MGRGGLGDRIVPGGTPNDEYETSAAWTTTRWRTQRPSTRRTSTDFRQTHNFAAGSPNDTEDWVKFTAVAGRRLHHRDAEHGRQLRYDVCCSMPASRRCTTDDGGSEYHASKLVYDRRARRPSTSGSWSTAPASVATTNYDIKVTSVVIPTRNRHDVGRGAGSPDRRDAERDGEPERERDVGVLPVGLTAGLRQYDRVAEAWGRERRPVALAGARSAG